MFIKLMILVVIIIIATFWIKEYLEFKEYNRSTYCALTGNSYKMVFNDTGKYGEYCIYKNLKYYEQIGGKFLFNVYIPSANENSTEIDVILITKRAVFIFESKNFGGWIFGDDKSKNWTQCLPAKNGKCIKYQFYNPIYQNNAHIYAFKKVVESTAPIYSIITFSERCELKKVPQNTREIKVIKRGNLNDTINDIYSSSMEILEDYDTMQIYHELYPYSQVREDFKIQHILNIRNKYKK